VAGAVCQRLIFTEINDDDDNDQQRIAYYYYNAFQASFKYSYTSIQLQMEK